MFRRVLEAQNWVRAEWRKSYMEQASGGEQPKTPVPQRY
jgi:hypothetical protein